MKQLYIPNEYEVVEDLAEKGCAVLFEDDPLGSMRKVDVFETWINQMTEHERMKLVIESLVFEIFIIEYVLLSKHVKNSDVREFHHEVSSILTKNGRFKQFMKSCAKFYASIDNRSLNTNESIVRFFKESLLRARLDQYFSILNANGYRSREQSIINFGYTVAKNFFGERSFLPLIAIKINERFNQATIEVGKLLAEEPKATRAQKPKAKTSNRPIILVPVVLFLLFVIYKLAL